jgi:ATP-dependent Lhr-like helicase
VLPFTDMAQPPLDLFGDATRAWFESAFDAPTPAQEGAWHAIASAKNALVVAPTGSGKTLAAFLWSIDALFADPARRRDGVRVLYVSPLKALAVDVERNLRVPLAGIRAVAADRGETLPPIEVGVRSGDTPSAERRRMVKKPPDVLITTPESLFLLLTSNARETLRSVDTVIVDEVHAVAATKRGAHLALSLERLDRLVERPVRRIGLSATVRPLDEVARFLGGRHPVEVVDARSDKALEVSIVVPVDDLSSLSAKAPISNKSRRSTTPTPDPQPAKPEPSIWPYVEARVLELIRAHRSTLVFANSRRLAERFCARLNELAGEEIARAHHGSVSRDQREQIESALKSGTLAAVVATSSLELGIDMGAIDLVVQIEAPTSVAAGLQRIGRAGHQVGAVSRGMVFPKYRGDLLESAVVCERMRERAIESLSYPRNPLDVLAQQIVAMVAMDDWTVGDLERVVHGAAPFAELPRRALEGVLDMLAGRYPSDAFAGLRARINWDRNSDRLSTRPGSRNIAVTSGGTIPDRGLFGVYLAGERRTRVGELDEEMVHESRPGEVFVLGASSWRIEEITADRVYVLPAPGQPGRMPFWHGDAPGRPIELGRALGAFVREVGALPEAARTARLRATGCDELAADNLARYLDHQRRATGVLPDDRTIVVERFRDAVGDWRLCLHTFFGARVHAPWAQAITRRLREQLGVEVQVIYSDDGIVVRVPDGEALPPADALVPEPEEIEDLVVSELGSSALFASRFREAAARALLLPRRRPGSRTPLWLQRQKAATLLQVAAQHETFPIVLESFRECLQDVFDLPALVDLLALIRRREVRVTEVETDAPSPFASSLQLAYVGAFMYDGDSPLAERRAQALALDRGVLAELMGREELRDLLDADVIAALECELQRLDPERRARSADDVHDLLRSLGDLTGEEIEARSSEPDAVAAWLAELENSTRAVQVHKRGDRVWIAVEDAGRYRDALDVEPPSGVPAAFTEPVEDPLGDLVRRFARTHGPFTEDEVAKRLAVGRAVARETLKALARGGRVAMGEFRPGASGREWIDAEVLRRLRRRCLAALRREVEPVAQEALAQLAVAWHDIGQSGPRLSGIDGLRRVVAQLQGVALPASSLESQILRARMPEYTAALADQLGSAGELVWAGAGSLGGNDGWVVLASAETAATLLPEPPDADFSPVAERVLEALRAGGALFFRQLSEIVGGPADGELLRAVWELVWAGYVTNDTLAPLRALLRGKPLKAPRATRRRRAAISRVGPAAAAGRWCLVPRPVADATRRRHAVAEQLLRRHGVVTRGAVAGDRIEGGFAAIYPLLIAFEERGHCRRGYFVEGLGGAQFALPGAVDRMRAEIATTSDRATLLAAADPANPFGAALPWPQRGEGEAGHRAGRKAGAAVILVGGRLTLYLERGGRTLLSYTTEETPLRAAVEEMAAAVRSGALGSFELERVDGAPIIGTTLERVLTEVGFRRTYRGFQMQG